MYGGDGDDAFYVGASTLVVDCGAGYDRVMLTGYAEETIRVGGSRTQFSGCEGCTGGRISARRRRSSVRCSTGATSEYRSTTRRSQGARLRALSKLRPAPAPLPAGDRPQRILGTDVPTSSRAAAGWTSSRAAAAPTRSYGGAGDDSLFGRAGNDKPHRRRRRRRARGRPRRRHPARRPRRRPAQRRLRPRPPLRRPGQRHDPRGRRRRRRHRLRPRQGPRREGLARPRAQLRDRPVGRGRRPALPRRGPRLRSNGSPHDDLGAKTATRLGRGPWPSRTCDSAELCIRARPAIAFFWGGQGAVEGALVGELEAAVQQPREPRGATSIASPSWPP